MKKNTIFIHIPKCGGSSLHYIMRREYGKPGTNVYVIGRTDDIPRFIALPEEKRAEIKVLMGHGRYGLHHYLHGKSRYFTFLRDPVDRCLSAYYYMRSFEHLVVHQKKLSLLEFYEDGHGPWALDIQTKKIAGVENNVAPCTEEVFQQAMDHLENNVDFVGFTEHFDASLIALKECLAWRKIPYYHRVNVTKNRKAANALPAEERAVLQNLNRFDMRLYEQAKKRFLGRILEKSNLTATERFQKRNQFHGRWIGLAHRGKGKLKRMASSIFPD